MEALGPIGANHEKLGLAQNASVNLPGHPEHHQEGPLQKEKDRLKTKVPVSLLPSKQFSIILTIFIVLCRLDDLTPKEEATDFEDVEDKPAPKKKSCWWGRGTTMA